MSKSKRLLICTIILFIVSLSIFTLILDLSRLFASIDLYRAYFVDLIKRINVILAASLVWLSGKDSLSPQDNIRMKYVFMVIIIGEILFLLSKPAAAIGCFAVCQCMLIARHGKGLGQKIAKASLAQRFKLALSAFAMLILFASGSALLYPLISLNSLIIMGYIYGIILSISLWTAMANYILGLFPYKNSKMIAAGMLRFYCCDVLVAMDGLLQFGTAWILATSFIWVFYTPAITLLALSCYSYKEKAYSSAAIPNT